MRKNLKKFITLFLCLILLAGSLAGCGGSGSQEDDGKLDIVVTIFPAYDWVCEILGEQAADTELTLLLDQGVDLHSYQPTAEDMVKIANCDLFIYVGGESDDWVEDALKESGNPNRVALNLLEMLGDAAKLEEVVEGMQADDDHDHDHAAVTGAALEEEHSDHEDHDAEDTALEEDHDHDDQEAVYDEHVWLSLKNAAILCGAIGDALGTIDPDHREIYAANAAAYTDKINALDQKYREVVNGSSKRVLLFGDRFPFRYMVDDYELDYYAAFVGCSAETEASFETVTFLAKKADELGLNVVLTIEGADHRIAETIISGTADKSQTVLSMDSLQSTTLADVQNGKTYLGAMEKNLEALKEALK